MEKVLEILEKNVQWIVLGLAVIFLGWIAYSYVYKPPATVLLGTHKVLPADVDNTTHNGAARALADDIASKKTSDFPTPDLVSSWRTHMQSPYGVGSAQYAWDSLAPTENLEGTQELFIKVHVASLPILPKAIPLPPITGLSVVQLPAPANANPNANPVQPVAAGDTKDLLWNTAGFTIPGKLLAQALIAPLNGQAQDPSLYNSALLQVVLQRQKSIGLDANGNPVFPSGDTGVEEIPPLTINQAGLQPIPREKDDYDPKFKYVDWALQNQNNVLIATPPFYTITAGTPWAPPQNPTPTTQPATAPAAPATPAAPPAAAPASGLKASAAGVASRTNASYTVIDTGRPPLGGMFPGNPGGPPPFGNFAPPANGATAGGQINPFAIQDDIQIWAHDETVKPGQTYRYRVIYKMKNPVFGVQKMAKDELVNQLAIASPPSDWSPAITVAETTKYWLAQIQRLDQPAKMDVAHWENGNWTLKKNVLLGPGDGVPGTDMTLVDVRIADPKSGREKYVLLVSNTGDLTRRDLAGDVADPDHQSMLTQLAPTPAPGIAPPGPAPRGRLIPGRGPNGLRGHE